MSQPLDFVGRYENLESDLRFVQQASGKKEAFSSHCVKSTEDRPLESDIDPPDRDYIEGLFKRDLERFSLAC